MSLSPDRDMHAELNRSPFVRMFKEPSRTQWELKCRFCDQRIVAPKTSRLPEKCAFCSADWKGRKS